MLFNSIDYLFFFPIVLLIYYLIPHKVKHVWLLLASYYFYMCWNAEYALLIFSSTVVTYVCGLALEKIKQAEGKGEAKRRCMKVAVFVTALLNFSVLFYFKYTNFVLYTVKKGFGLLGIHVDIPSFDVLLPVGISFFTFQVVGYVIDVYRNETSAEKNFVRYALFVSFFPKLVSGPIERSENLLNQLKEIKSFNVFRVKSGLLTIAYGLFLKIVIADNISNIINPVFSKVEEYGGMELLVAAILFAFQVYCDFEGYTKMAIGSAELLGYHLLENFRAPYLAISVKDFWRRWHISLTSWFRDYLYIPIGGSKQGKIRKQVNTLIVFLCSGLWHGAAWHYVLWGGLNGLLSVGDDLLTPIKKRWSSCFKMGEKSLMYRTVCRLITFILIDITWVFFRADSVRDAIYILVSVVKDFRFIWFTNGGFATLFLSEREMMIIMLSLLILFLVDYLRERGNNIKTIIFSWNIVFRWMFYWMCFMIILYWGAYGLDYEQKQFIYFQF